MLALAVCSHGVFLAGARAFPSRSVLLPRLSPNAMAMFDIEGPADEAPAARDDGARGSERSADPLDPPEAPGAGEPEAPAPALAGAEPPSSSAPDGAISRGLPQSPAPATPDAPVAALAAAEPGPGSSREPSGAAGPEAPASGAASSPSDGFSDPNEEPSATSLAGLLAPGLGGVDVAGRIAVEGAIAPAAPTSAPVSTAVDKKKANDVLASTLVGQDRKKGIDLPATGVVTATVSDATRALPVGHNTRASFEVKLAPGGKVAGVRVLNASAGDATAWDGAAKAVATSLSSKALSLGDASKSGATIVVSVTVKHVYPTGTAKATEVKPVCANQILNDLADAASDTPTKAPESTLPLFQDENGRPCIPIGVGGTADAANIGATKQIQVQATSKVLVGGKEALPEVQAINKDPFWVPSTKEGPRPVAPYKLRKYKRDREKKK